MSTEEKFRMPKKKSQKQLEAEINKFNAKYPVGSEVVVNLDTGESKLCTVKYPASILGGHSAVGWFEELRSCHSLTHVIF